MSVLYSGRLDSPAGPLVLFCNDAFIIRLLLPNDNEAAETDRLGRLLGSVRFCGANPVTDTACRELEAYFQGKLRCFSVQPAFLWGTAFSQAVWRGVARIPYGQTVSYEALGQACGASGARAVGNAVGRNPVPILVPCHRVLRKNGDLGGFGGGLPLKRLLLALEGVSVTR